MDKVTELLNAIWSLDIDQIAIISLLATLLIFVIGKFSENRIKKFEIWKAEYQKSIDFFQDIFSNSNLKDTAKFAERNEFKKKFISMGASAAIFGSKKLYSTYVFYRILALDKNVQNSRWYSKDMISFYITDFTKPEYKKKFYHYYFNKLATKFNI